MGKAAAVVWDQSFLGYDLGGDHPLNPVRLDLTIRLATELGVLDGVSLIAPDAATDDDIERVHEAAYLNAVRAAPHAAWDVGHGLGTSDNPVFERMHEASALIVGGTMEAARRIASGEADRAVSIAGGLHHAMRDHAAGFCVYNDCAVAISWLLDNGFDRIAYVDVDVHHGDGVQNAFYDDPRVLTISVHQNPMTLWPGTGWPAELGGKGAEGTAVNLPLPPGTRDGNWLRAFHAVVPGLLGAFRPQILVTQCGVDSHREDPLADLSLSVDGHRAIYRALRDLAEAHAGGKWLALGGGGYELLRVVPRSWTHLLATVLDRDVEPNVPLPPGWVSHASRLAPNRPLPSSMTDAADTTFTPWGGDGDTPVDGAIRNTRRAVHPLHGLDPDDPRD
ncbi:acetoin utilization protein AcuC [Umezawaea tangerina]|uniref:Acetoin utilization protein AcuC n=1 Tax=Umezawaea tangerina TaxID=84725 RepID=A0A2T0SA80_9PSEU|nr:acetoin utilization protein AcuC [Umezawaea tangerina]PRY30326.1 acetoin utilization protein AcuC [Umezawaea tangerina]